MPSDSHSTRRPRQPIAIPVDRAQARSALNRGTMRCESEAGELAAGTGTGKGSKSGAGIADTRRLSESGLAIPRSTRHPAMREPTVNRSLDRRLPPTGRAQCKVLARRWPISSQHLTVHYNLTLPSGLDWAFELPGFASLSIPQGAAKARHGRGAGKAIRQHHSGARHCRFIPQPLLRRAEP